jgi:transcriptional regulator with XRE-family HTH domain
LTSNKTNRQQSDKRILAIAAKIRKLRIEKGYTNYEHFAIDNDLPTVHYWRIESGKTNPTIQSLLKILDIHKLTLKDFFSDIE